MIEKTNFALVDCTEDADLLSKANGGYCWHEYDTEGDPADGRWSIDYPSESAAMEAMKNNQVEWE